MPPHMVLHHQVSTPARAPAAATQVNLSHLPSLSKSFQSRAMATLTLPACSSVASMALSSVESIDGCRLTAAIAPASAAAFPIALYFFSACYAPTTRWAGVHLPAIAHLAHCIRAYKRVERS
eukprot:NODE_12030_length_1250_cov_3.138914.p4 GENE.NODE_12030_length_1250_cov_3.138914~~NODE_12030_length_1250_cov_3.138914.p4  ORF type:complete len:122 (-),score=18.69 NODE_12030_length_1250_cov_3.138914:345-710(-)